jgi:hypothetical protein
MKFIRIAACVSNLDLSNTDPDTDVLMNPDLTKFLMGKKFTHLLLKVRYIFVRPDKSLRITGDAFTPQDRT